MPQAKAPKKPPTVEAPPSEAPPEVKPGFMVEMDLEDPFLALHGLLTGAVFDAPQKLVKSAAPAAESADDAQPQAPQPAPAQAININLGGLFKPVKRKSGGVTAPPAQAQGGTAPGDNEQAP